jgi:hypothetical protein
VSGQKINDRPMLAVASNDRRRRAMATTMITSGDPAPSTNQVAVFTDDVVDWNFLGDGHAFRPVN